MGDGEDVFGPSGEGSWMGNDDSEEHLEMRGRGGVKEDASFVGGEPLFVYGRGKWAIGGEEGELEGTTLLTSGVEHNPVAQSASSQPGYPKGRRR